MSEEKRNIENEKLEWDDDILEQEDTEKEEINYEEKLKESNEKYIRLYADFENYKKRIKKELDESFEKGIIASVTPLLSIIDNYTRAMNSIDKEKNPELYQGLEIIKKEFDKYLLTLGIEEIDAINQPFDPEYHNAVFFVEDERFDEPTVIEELQKGYIRGDKIIRYSMVKVSN